MAEGELEVKLVPLSAIVDWLEPRQFIEADVRNMAESLRIHGQIQNITVEPLDEKGERFRGIAGRLRFEAAKRANIPVLECKVKRFKSDSERVAYQLAENLHRKELTALQRAEWLKRYRDMLRQELPDATSKSIMCAVTESIEKLTGEETSEDTVYRCIQVAEQLPNHIKSIIGVNPNVGLEHCLELLRLGATPEKQAELTEKTIKEGWSVQRLKAKVDEALGLAKPEKPWTCDCCEREFTEETKTQISLCPECAAEFQVFKHERVEKPAGADSTS